MLPTSGHTCVVVGGTVIQYGGKAGPTSLVEDVHALDVDDNTWRRVECSGQIPKGRAFHTAVIHSHQMYVFGGLLAVGVDDVHYNLYNVFAHPDALSEEILSGDPASRLRDPQYLTPKTARRQEPCPLHCLDLRGQAWWRPMLHAAGQLPPSRCHHNAAIYRGKMFIHGGYSVHTSAQPDDGELKRVYTTYFLDLDSLMWRQVTGMGDPSPKMWGAACALSGPNWVLYGGVDIEACQETPNMYVINLEDGRGKVLALDALVGADEKVSQCTKAMHSVIRWGDRLIIFGGSNHISSTASNELWSFDLINGQFAEIPTQEGPEARFGHAACVVGEEMYVFGGLSAKLLRLEDTWAFSMRTGKWRRVDTALVPHVIDNVRGHPRGHFVGHLPASSPSISMPSEGTTEDLLEVIAEGARISHTERDATIAASIQTAKKEAHRYDIGTDVSSQSPSHVRREMVIRGSKYRDLATALPEDAGRVLKYWKEELDALHNESSRWLSSSQAQSTQLISSYFNQREGGSDMVSPSRAHSYEAVRLSQTRPSSMYISPSIVKLGLEGRLARRYTDE